MVKEAENEISKLKDALDEKVTEVVALKSAMHDTVRAEVDAVAEKWRFVSCLVLSMIIHDPILTVISSTCCRTDVIGMLIN
jgi:hypothetical protein